MNRLSETIRARRKELGLTLDDVAAVVGVTPGALSHVESGRRLPDARNAIGIARALHIDPDELLTLLDEAHADRRATQAGWTMPSERSASRPRTAPAGPAPVFRAMPIDAMFGTPVPAVDREWDQSDPALHEESRPGPAVRVSPQHSQAMYTPAPARDRARFSPDSGQRLHAAEELAEDALRAIRTLRGMLDDDDPMIAREARRLLRELDVRGPEE